MLIVDQMTRNIGLIARSRGLQVKRMIQFVILSNIAVTKIAVHCLIYNLFILDSLISQAAKIFEGANFCNL